MLKCAPPSSESTMSSHLIIDYITDEITSHPDSGGDVYVSPDSRYVVIVDNEGNTLTVSSVTDNGTGIEFTLQIITALFMTVERTTQVCLQFVSVKRKTCVSRRHNTIVIETHISDRVLNTISIDMSIAL